MPIFPLPQFEADLQADKEAYDALKAPKSIVVRFGSMKMIAEFPYDGSAKPGCGSKLVCRTHRGTELCEMLTSTCPNSGCNKSVTRDEMLTYINNSGGKDFPFSTDGKVLRVATHQDLNHMASLEAKKHNWLQIAREKALQVGLTNIKVVEVEPILGSERLIVHFLCEERVDFRPLVMELAQAFDSRVDMHQVGARDEARLVADYEKCGQHCCCRQFLKVLKPVSMKSAKVQKATLDPLKISGRCGRLMCCLRYEDNTYDELKKNLPKKKVPLMTPDGPGLVLDTQILTQLVLIKLDSTGEEAAYPVETLTKLTDEQIEARNKLFAERQAKWEELQARRGPNPGQDTSQSQRNDRQGNRRELPRPNNQSNQPGNAPKGAPQPGPQQGQTRRPLTDEEKAKKQMQKLVPQSDFRPDDLHKPIDRSLPPTTPPATPPPPSSTPTPPSPSGSGQTDTPPSDS